MPCTFQDIPDHDLVNSVRSVFSHAVPGLDSSGHNIHGDRIAAGEKKGVFLCCLAQRSGQDAFLFNTARKSADSIVQSISGIPGPGDWVDATVGEVVVNGVSWIVGDGVGRVVPGLCPIVIAGDGVTAV